MKPNLIKTSILIAAIVICIFGYLVGYVVFLRYHPGIGSLKTGEIVYTVPDRPIYRVLAVFFAPISYLTNKRINPDNREN